MSYLASDASTRCGFGHVLDGVTPTVLEIADDDSICATGRV